MSLLSSAPIYGAELWVVTYAPADLSGPGVDPLLDAVAFALDGRGAFEELLRFAQLSEETIEANGLVYPRCDPPQLCRVLNEITPHTFEVNLCATEMRFARGLLRY